MQTLIEDLWLCEDCVQAAVNGDFTSLDYHYTPQEAQRRVSEITGGLSALGPGLVPDWTPENNQEYRCVDCGSNFLKHGSSWDSGNEEVVATCPECGSESWVYRDSGYQEFSTTVCDCCGEALSGGRHRFALLGG